MALLVDTPRPLGISITRTAFRIIGSLAPGLTAQGAEQLWSRSRRTRIPRTPAWPPEGTQHFTLGSAGRRVRCYAWGDGPPILLVHGWNSHSGGLRSLISALCVDGHRVLAFDAPGHGRSQGRGTNLMEYAQLIGDIARREGPLQGLLGHSFGGLAATFALGRGLTAGRLIVIASPGRLGWLLEGFAQRTALPRRAVSALRARIERRLGDAAWQPLCVHSPADTLRLPALVVHDVRDTVVPWRVVRADWTRLPNHRLLLTDGLGHRRILHHPSTVEAVRSFLRPADTAAAGPSE